MASISYKKTLMDLTGFLSGNDKIYYDFLKLFDTPSGMKIPDDFPVSVKEFYTELDGFRMEWIHADFLDAAFVSGRVNILQSEKLVSDWKDILWFDFTEENDPIRTFRILDFF